MTVALCMIVRDESAVIERCIGSVRGLIDSWVICDTGSTDDTVGRIRSLLGDLPGQLYERPWRDFGHNRTELMELAFRSADYLLLLDADMTVRSSAELPALEADAYLVQHAGELDYWVPRLVRGDRRWWFEGPTHEYLATEGPFSQERLSGFCIEHHADGSSRSVKFERDRELLERRLALDPNDERATFYLAQTYADLGDVDRAIELYGRRADMGGWGEEAWYARYRQGALLVDRDWSQAVEVLLRAADERPDRAEPLYELARGCRFRELFDDGYRYAVRGRAVAYPHTGLFVHREVYEWALDFEFAVAAYWAGHPDAALTVNEQLLASDALPKWCAPYVRMNLDHCRRALDLPVATADPVDYVRAEVDAPLLGSLIGAARLGEIGMLVEPLWPSTNPSIAADGDGFRAIVRTVNYTSLEDQSYEIFDDDGIVRTINYVVRLDGDLVVVDVRPLIDDSTATRHTSGVVGYEDCRLIRVGDRWCALATVRELNEHGRCQIALLELDDDRITSVRVLPSPDSDRDEKNWMPFTRDGKLHAVYSCDPTIIYQVGESDLRLVSEKPAATGSAFRGGSQGVRVEGGSLFVVHEVEYVGWLRVYTQRFVLIDDSFALSAISKPFRFVGEPIEFCAGMARRGDDLVLSFGIADRHACIAVVGVTDVLALLDAV